MSCFTISGTTAKAWPKQTKTRTPTRYIADKLWGNDMTWSEDPWADREREFVWFTAKGDIELKRG